MPVIYTSSGNQFSSVQFSRSVMTGNSQPPWIAARQTFLSITNSPSLLKLMPIESVMPSNHLFLCHPLLLPSIFPSIRVFLMSQFFTSGGQSIGVSISASVLPMNIQDWFLLGLTGLISVLSKRLSRVFSSTTLQKYQFLGPQPFPSSGSFQVSQFFASGSQSIGVSASTSVLPMNTQDWSPLGWTGLISYWSPLGWTGLISLPSKGLSRVFSNTTVQKHQFFGAQLSL